MQVLVAILIATTFAVQPHLLRIGVMPADGDPYLCLDLDVEGNLMEINLQQASGRILGRLPSRFSSPEFSLEGYYLADEETAWLLVCAPGEHEYVLYSWIPADGEPVKTPLSLDLRGDIALVPVSRRYFLGKAGNANVYFDNKTFMVKELSFSLPLEPEVSFNDAGNRVYISPGYGRASGRSVLSLEVTAPWEFHHLNLEELPIPTDNERIWYKAIDPPYVLVSLAPPESKSRRWAIVNVESKEYLLVTQPVPTYMADYYLSADNEREFSVTSIAKELRDNEFNPLGRVYRTQLRAQSPAVMDAPTLTYEPRAQVVIFDAEGSPCIVPRYQFDYVTRNFLRPKQANRFQPEPSSHDEIKQRLEERRKWLRENLDKEVVQETFHGPATFMIKHLEIQ